jgi:hypothetical protein
VGRYASFCSLNNLDETDMSSIQSNLPVSTPATLPAEPTNASGLTKAEYAETQDAVMSIVLGVKVEPKPGSTVILDSFTELTPEQQLSTLRELQEPASPSVVSGANLEPTSEPGFTLEGIKDLPPELQRQIMMEPPPAPAPPPPPPEPAFVPNDDLEVLSTFSRHMDKVPVLLHTVDLDRLANDESVPADLRDAYAALRDKPELQAKLDAADLSHSGREADGIISQGDLRSVFNDPEFIQYSRDKSALYTEFYVPSDAQEGDLAPRQMTASDAARELYLYADSLPNNIDRNALQQIVDGQCLGKCPAQLQAAAQYMLEHEETGFSQLAPDGSVSRGELENNAASMINLRQDELDALNVVGGNKHHFLRDGGMSRESLTGLAADQGVPIDVRVAAETLLKSEVVFGMLDNGEKGHVSKDAWLARNRIITNDGLVGNNDIDGLMGKLSEANRTPDGQSAEALTYAQRAKDDAAKTEYLDAVRAARAERNSAPAPNPSGVGEESSEVTPAPNLAGSDEDGSDVTPASDSSGSNEDYSAAEDSFAMNLVLQSMYSGMDDDPVIKQSHGDSGSLERVLKKVSTGLDVVKTGVDVVASFLPPPFGAAVASVGAGIGAVNNFGVKAGMDMLNGVPRGEAMKTAAKGFAFDAAASAVSAIPGAGVAAKAGVMAAKQAATTFVREGAELAVREGAEAAVTQGGREAAEAGAREAAEASAREAAEGSVREGAEAGAREGTEASAKETAESGAREGGEETFAQTLKDEAKGMAEEEATALAQNEIYERTGLEAEMGGGSGEGPTRRGRRGGSDGVDGSDGGDGVDRPDANRGGDDQATEAGRLNATDKQRGTGDKTETDNKKPETADERTARKKKEEEEEKAQLDLQRQEAAQGEEQAALEGYSMAWMLMLQGPKSKLKTYGAHAQNLDQVEVQDQAKAEDQKQDQDSGAAARSPAKIESPAATTPVY